MPPVLRVLLLAVALALPAAPAAASEIVFQCGGGVCAIDPDSGAGPRTLTTAGRVAGVTDDGRTAAWVQGSDLVLRPLAAGGREATLFSGEIYDFPLISPDGTQALWSFYLGGYGWYTYRAPSEGSGYPPAIASSTYQTSHGWMGSTVLVARRGYEAVPPRLCAEQIGGASCDTLLATEPDPSTQIAFPDGRRDGGAVVAVRGPEGTGVGIPVSGRLSVYSPASGTRVADLTTGPADAYPSYSYEGDRVAFERDGGIWIVPAAGGTPTRIATGSQPYWGGPRTVPGTPGPTPTPGPSPTPAPTPTPAPGTPGGPGATPAPPSTPGPGAGTPVTGAAIRSTTLRYRRGVVKVQVRCAGTRTCTGSVRLLKGRTALGARGYRLKGGRSAAVSVRPTRSGRRTIARSRTHKVTVQLRPAGRRAVSKTLTLKR